MPSNASLSISSLINVSATLAAAAAQAQSTQTMLVLVDDPNIDTVTRIASFASSSAVVHVAKWSNSAAVLVA